MWDPACRLSDPLRPLGPVFLQTSAFSPIFSEWLTHGLACGPMFHFFDGLTGRIFFLK
jgi:hypothetical protein